MALRTVFWIAVGVILGFVLGGVPARRQVTALRAERDALQAKLDDASRPNLLQALLPTVESKPKPRRESPRADAGVAPPRVAGRDDAPAGPARRTADGADRAAPERDRRAHGDLPSLDQFDDMVTAQRARIAAARSALIEQAGLDAAQIARIDQSVERMNGKLLGYGEELIDQLASKQPPSTLQMLGAGHDVSGILYDGQRELEAVVGKTATGIDHSALEIWNYVDVGQWRSIVKDKIDSLGAAGASGRTR